MMNYGSSLIMGVLRYCGWYSSPYQGWDRGALFTLLLTMVGSKVTRKNTSMRIPNLETFTLLLRSVNQTSMGGTVNTATPFVITISNNAREKLPPAISDCKRGISGGIRHLENVSLLDTIILK